MANFQSIFIRSRGIPATGLSPVFETLVDIQTGQAFTPQPTIEEIGNGWYRVISEINYPVHLLGVIDAGASINDQSERKIPVNFRYSDFDIDNKEVYVVNVIDEPSDSVTFLCYLLVNGKIQKTNLTSVSLLVYDSNHNLLFTLTTSSFTNGVAVLIKNTPNFVGNRSYYAVPTITTSNEIIESADTFAVIQ